MSAALETWVTEYGAYFVFLATFASCLGVPIPALVVMLAAGAFAATSDTAIWPHFVAAVSGALLAGFIVFALGRRYGTRIVTRFERHPTAGPMIARAHATHDRWGSAAVFIGSSFVAQLGPAVIVIAGAAELGWWRFHLGHIPGRLIWVSTYILLGFAFAESVGALAAFAGYLSWFVAGLIGLIAFSVAWRRVKRPGRIRERRSGLDPGPPDSHI